MRTILLILSTWLVMPSVVEAAEDDPCGKLDPVSVVECEDRNADRSDKELNETYSKLRRRLVLSPDAQQKELAAQLVVAQRAWIKYRDELCKLEGKAALTGNPNRGNLYSLTDTACKSRMAVARMKELQDFAKEYGF